MKVKIAQKGTSIITGLMEVQSRFPHRSFHALPVSGKGCLRLGPVQPEGLLSSFSMVK